MGSSVRSGTGLVTDRRYLDHLPEDGVPESPRRLAAIHEVLESPEISGAARFPAPRPARREELGWIHTEAHIDRIAATSGRDFTRLTRDTFASSGSDVAARLAAGGLFRAVEQVCAGSLRNAFLLARPPGHHAEAGRAMGYCLFNTVALGAMFARRAVGLPRVLIVDWDAHHGNGTQHAFETDPSVLFFSAHQYPLFPGTGLFTEVGRGPGEGYTINLPLPRGYGDPEYLALFERVLRPVAEAFRPELILVSAGFDIHRSDPLGGMRMTADGFAGLTRSLMDLAEGCCGGRLVLCLEGGYHIPSLAESVRAVILELMDRTVHPVAERAAAAKEKKVRYALHRCRQVHQAHWKCLDG